MSCPSPHTCDFYAVRGHTVNQEGWLEAVGDGGTGDQVEDEERGLVVLVERRGDVQIVQ